MGKAHLVSAVRTMGTRRRQVIHYRYSVWLYTKGWWFWRKRQALFHENGAIAPPKRILGWRRVALIGWVKVTQSPLYAQFFADR
jgi:hypothetical protein